MENHTTTTEVGKPFKAYSEDYMSQGWEAPFPLPKNAKYPPPTGLTGRIPRVGKETVRAVWVREMENSNLGIRMQIAGQYDVIALDVDQYKDKKGKENLDKLMDELGELPLSEIPRSTRRGVKSPAAQYFFLVPKDLEWKVNVCADVDTVQFTHRYSAVWPSEVDGEQYRWYLGDDEIGVPNVKDLPVLPEKWVRHLERGNRITRHAPGELLSHTESEKWLSMVSPGWEEQPSAGFKTGLEPKLKAMAGNAHDTLVESLWWAVRYAALDGQTGLRAVLEELREKFFTEAERPDDNTIKQEYARVLLGAVNKIRGEVEAGEAVPFLSKAVPVCVEALTSLAGADEAGKVFSKTIDHAREMLLEFPTEFAVGEILAYLLPEIVAVEEGKDSPVFFDGYRGRDLTKTELRRVLKNQLRTVLEAIRPEEDNDYLKDAIKNASRFANQTRNHSAVVAALATALADNDREADVSEFDIQPHLLGLSGNLVVDLSMATPDCELSDIIRPRDLSERELLRKTLIFDVPTSIEALETLKAAGGKCAMQQILEVVEPDDETRSYFFEVYGYAWYGDNSNKVAPGIRGKADTGKSTVSKMTFNFGSDYFGTVSLESLTKSADQNNAQLARVASGRMLIMEELSFESRGQAETYKKITGGNGFDVTAKFKDTEHYSSATPWFETNDAPTMRMDEAMRDRLVVFPFEGDTGEINRVVKKFVNVGEEYYVDPASKAWWLREVARGYARFIARKEWRDGIPDRVLKCTHQFAVESDPIVAMLEQYTVQDPEGYAPAQNLLMCLNKDADPGEKISSNAFSAEMRSRGYTKVRKRINGSENAVFAFEGLRLNVSAVKQDAA